MRGSEERLKVKALVSQGLNDCQIARVTGIPRTTIRDWRKQRFREPLPFGQSKMVCPICVGRELDQKWYAYLLGLYLGDGCISTVGGVERLRIVLDRAYPNIVFEAAVAMQVIRDGGASSGVVQDEGCVEVGSYWKHWSCLFPQHGPGRKHKRKIQLQITLPIFSLCLPWLVSFMEFIGLR